jgi:hypothetical protein
MHNFMCDNISITTPTIVLTAIAPTKRHFLPIPAVIALITGWVTIINRM